MCSDMPGPFISWKDLPSQKDIFEKHIQSLPDEVQMIIAEILKKDGRLKSIANFPELQRNADGRLYDCQISFELPPSPEFGNQWTSHDIYIKMPKK